MASKINYHALVKPDRVHSRLYTDPAIFDEELERIFHRGWVFVGHRGEVPNPGDFRQKRIGRQPVIMVRDASGQVNLLLNRCRHRGAMVCNEERGNTRAFRCAYHGWTYKLDGTLAGVPYPDGYDESFRREEYGLARVPRMAEYRGLIFGSLSPAGITLEEHLGRAARELDMFVGLSDADEIIADCGAHKYDYRANWKLQVENAMDGYHAITLHESFLGVLAERARQRAAADDYKGQFEGSRFAVTRDLGGGHVMLDYWNRLYDALNNDPIPEVEPVSASGREHFAELVRRFGHHRAAHNLTQGMTHTFIFPNLILIGIQMRVVHPVRVDFSQVAVFPTRLNWLSEAVNATRLRGHEAFFGPAGFGGPDDTEIFERVQTGLRADRLAPWLMLSRGMNRERRDSDGTLIGERTDEVTQRGIWRQWMKEMTGDGSARRAARKPATLQHADRVLSDLH
ncbi:MAG TPA: Rieske 2Fe-2S domain-containing protein [Candidatus Binataceae bacterium]|nr:Rieske 2Fe-2S domain-containing protein [Candidatus Binataceae bacterium]